MAGAVLLIATAVAWYRAPGGASLSAWEAFDVTDLVLALAGATALVIGVATIVRPTGAFAVPASSVAAGLGALATLLVLIRLFSPPDDLSVRAGAWLGLVSCLAIGVAFVVAVGLLVLAGVLLGWILPELIERARHRRGAPPSRRD